AGLPNSIRVSRHLSPTSPFAGFSTISIFSIPLMISEAFSILVIAAQIAALDPLIVTFTSTIMVCLLGFERLAHSLLLGYEGIGKRSSIHFCQSGSSRRTAAFALAP